MATIKQNEAIKKIVVKRGKGKSVSVSRVMREVGYKEKTAKNPKNLTESKAYREIFDKYLPDELLAKKHKELLTVPIRTRRYVKGDLEIDETRLDSNAVSKGLDMAYKLKGDYAPEKKQITGTLNLAQLCAAADDEK